MRPISGLPSSGNGMSPAHVFTIGSAARNGSTSSAWPRLTSMPAGPGGGGGEDETAAGFVAAARGREPASARPRRQRGDLARGEHARAEARGQRGEGARGLARVGLRALRRVHRAEQALRPLRLQAPDLAVAEQLHLVAALAERAHTLSLEVGLVLGVDRLQRARLAELDVLAEIELDGLEDLEAAGGEMRLEVRLVAPADRIDLAGVDAGGAGGDLTALE